MRECLERRAVLWRAHIEKLAPSQRGENFFHTSEYQQIKVQGHDRTHTPLPTHSGALKGKTLYTAESCAILQRLSWRRCISTTYSGAVSLCGSRSKQLTHLPPPGYTPSVTHGKRIKIARRRKKNRLFTKDEIQKAAPSRVSIC